MTAAASSAPTSSALPADAIAVTALEELQFLGQQRREALRSGEFTRADLLRYEERLAAHIDVLVARGPAILEWLLAQLQEAETIDEVYGIAVALLASGDERAAQGLLTRLAPGEPEPVAAGLQASLRHGPIERLAPKLREWLTSGAPREAAVAAEALAFHRLLDKKTPQLTELQNDSDPVVCRAAWRAMALAD
jgi:hypothetical protein